MSDDQEQLKLPAPEAYRSEERKNTFLSAGGCDLEELTGRVALSTETWTEIRVSRVRRLSWPAGVSDAAGVR